MCMCLCQSSFSIASFPVCFSFFFFLFLFFFRFCICICMQIHTVWVYVYHTHTQMNTVQVKEKNMFQCIHTQKQTHTDDQRHTEPTLLTGLAVWDCHKHTAVDLNPPILPVSHPVCVCVTSPRWLSAAITMGIPIAQELAEVVLSRRNPQSANSAEEGVRKRGQRFKG